MSSSGLSLGYQKDGSWNVYAGDANKETFQYTDDEGSPINLTGAKFKATARTDPLSSKSMEAVCSIVDAAQGLFDVSWPGDAVRTILAGSVSWTGVWDLQYTPVDGTVITLLPRMPINAYEDIAR